MGDLELINRVREKGGEMEEERFIIMVISRFLASCSGIKRRGLGVMREGIDGGERGQGKEGVDNPYFFVCGGEERVGNGIRTGYFHK